MSRGEKSDKLPKFPPLPNKRLQISERLEMVREHLERLQIHPESPGGRIVSHIKNWKEITRDQRVLDIVYGMELEKGENLSQKSICPTKGTIQVLSLLEQALKDGVIELTKEGEKDEFKNSLMIWKKWNRGWRMILNLKRFNKQNTKKIHFKLELLDSILNLITLGSFIALIDLSQAFHTIPLAVSSQKLTKFAVQFNAEIIWFQYRVLPMGYTHSPLLFTKLMAALKQLL